MRLSYVSLLVLVFFALGGWLGATIVSMIEQQKRDDLLVEFARAQVGDRFVAAVMNNNIAEAESLLSETYRVRLRERAESIGPVIKKIEQTYNPRSFSYWPHYPNEMPAPIVSHSGTEISLGGQFGSLRWARVEFKLVRKSGQGKWEIDDITVTYGQNPNVPDSGTGAVPQEPVTTKGEKK